MGKIKLDDIDREIIRILQTDGRITNNQLAQRINLTTSPTLERVRRLERLGIIEGYSAKINAEAVGNDLIVFCLVSLALHQWQTVEEFSKEIQKVPEVLACYHITGDADFLLQVVVADTHEYQQILKEKLTQLPGIQKIHTSVVLSTLKEQSALSIKNEEDDNGKE